MSTKLSESLASLSQKTKSVEDKVSAASTEAKEKLDARIAESKAEAEKSKANFISNVESAKASADAQGRSIRETISQKVEQLKAAPKAQADRIKNAIEEKKHAFDVTVAEANYLDAAAYAENSVQWAMVALAEVETAALEAFEAKLKWDELKKQ